MLEAAPCPVSAPPHPAAALAPLQCMLFATPGNETKPKPNAGEKEKTKPTGTEGEKKKEKKSLCAKKKLKSVDFHLLLSLFFSAQRSI